MTRPWFTAALPSSSGAATRRVSGGRVVGAPIGCRELRSAAQCGSVLLEPGAVRRQGTGPGARSQYWAGHTTQGTSAGPADTGKRRAWSPAAVGRLLGPPGTSTGARSDRYFAEPARGVARRGF